MASQGLALILLNTLWYIAYNFGFTKINKYVLRLTFKTLSCLFFHILMNIVKYFTSCNFKASLLIRKQNKSPPPL